MLTFEATGQVDPIFLAMTTEYVKDALPVSGFLAAAASAGTFLAAEGRMRRGARDQEELVYGLSLLSSAR